MTSLAGSTPSLRRIRGGWPFLDSLLSRAGCTFATAVGPAVGVTPGTGRGLLMPVLSATDGANALTNRFEVEAGLEKGGYL